VILQNFRGDRQSVRNFDDFDIRADFIATQKIKSFSATAMAKTIYTVTNRLGREQPFGIWVRK